MPNSEPQILSNDPNVDEAIDISVADLVSDLAAGGDPERTFTAREVTEIVQRRLHKANKRFQRHLEKAVEAAAEHGAMLALQRTGAVTTNEGDEEDE